MQKEKEKKKKVGKPFWSHVDFSLFVLMNLNPASPESTPTTESSPTRRCVSCSDRFGSLRAAAPCCEELLAIQLFHLRCPAASQGAHIKRRAQQLPIFLGCCQKKKLEPCLVVHVLRLQKVSSVRRHLFFFYFPFITGASRTCFPL